MDSVVKLYESTNEHITVVTSDDAELSFPQARSYQFEDNDDLTLRDGDGAEIVRFRATRWERIYQADSVVVTELDEDDDGFDFGLQN
ncbi:MAG: hypothetical protein ACRDO8_01615 [Nocardioidaceae bacterium]